MCMPGEGVTGSKAQGLRKLKPAIAVPLGIVEDEIH